MRVAITGAAGLLGAAVLPALRDSGHETFPLARDVDVTDHRALLHAIAPHRPDWIFHLAAFTRVDLCETEVERAHLVNGLGARNAAMAAVQSGAALLALSTDYVFGGEQRHPYREYDPARPLGVYGQSKWAGEQAIREVCARHVIVRTSWLFGKGGPNFVDTIVARAREGQPLSVVDDQHGSPTYTPDLAAQLVRLADGGHFGTFHCTNSGEATWYDLAEQALRVAGLDVKMERTTTARLGRPAPRPAYSVLDNTWAERVTGSRMPDWQDAVERHLRASAA